MTFTIYGIIIIFPVLHHVICLKEFDPKCKYTVHLPEASWNTAYDVCQETNKTLANISVLADLYMVDLVLKEVDKFLDFKDDILNSGIWFNGFIRVSNQGNTVETCKSLDCALPVKTTSVGLEDGMLCLFYNRTDLNIYPEDCNKSKAFICESKDKGPPYESCMETSKTSSLKDLCYDRPYPSPTSAQQCESLCIKEWPCYTMTWTTNTCKSYLYSDNPLCSFGGNCTSLRHKSIFLFNNEDYMLSASKPLAEWCTEPRTLPGKDTECHGALSVLHEDSWKTYGAKCRYSVRMPEASWHTAYDVCEQNNHILAEITSLSEMYIMEDLLNDVENLFVDPFNVSVGLWIGGFMGTSDKEILTPDCKSLKFLSAIHIPAEEFTEEIRCLYYNRTAMKIYTDSCKKTKPFICERKEIGPSSCLETSETSSLKDRVPQKLCFDVYYGSVTNDQQCESSCIQHSPCYTMMIWNGDCRGYRYRDDPACRGLGSSPPTSLRHKSIFKFSSSDFAVSDPKPIAEWCPEPKKVMIRPEKNCNVPTRTTPDDFKISKGWEFIDIFNDLNGDMKSKMAVVLDDNDGTCLPLPTQEDFTPFLMMRMPTEPVFGIQTKAFTITISGMGISCNRHSNSRMLQVSYRAIKEPTQFCTLTDNNAVPDAFSRCVFRCDCPDPAHCRDVNLYLASGNAKGAWSLCEVKATNS